MGIAASIRHCGGSADFVRNQHILPESSGASIQVSGYAPKCGRRVTRLLHAALLMALAGFPLAASAAYKCADANGHYTYQDVPCDPAPNAVPSPAASDTTSPVAATPAPPVAAAPAPVAAAPVTAAPPAVNAAPQAVNAAPAAAAAVAPAAATPAAAAQPEPYLGGDADTADPNADQADDSADDGDGQAGADDRTSADDAADEAAAKASMDGIFARIALKALIWLALAGLIGYRATQRNRGFFKWAIMALVFSPALVYLALRLMGPADEMA